MDAEKIVRDHLLSLLNGGDAHLDFESAICDLPKELRSSKMPGSLHTPWRLVEHMRISQWDILEFCRTANHVSPEFPNGYWPEGDGPADDASWDYCVESFRRDQKEMTQLVANPSTDLFSPIPHGQGQTILREALLVADHNAYHLGQLVMLRRYLGAWSDD